MTGYEMLGFVFDKGEQVAGVLLREWASAFYWQNPTYAFRNRRLNEMQAAIKATQDGEATATSNPIPPQGAMPMRGSKNDPIDSEQERYDREAVTQLLRRVEARLREKYLQGKRGWQYQPPMTHYSKVLQHLGKMTEAMVIGYSDSGAMTEQEHVDRLRNEIVDLTAYLAFLSWTLEEEFKSSEGNRQ